MKRTLQGLLWPYFPKFIQDGIRSIVKSVVRVETNNGQTENENYLAISDLQQFVMQVWDVCLHREPLKEELAANLSRLESGLNPISFLDETVKSDEARHKKTVEQAVPTLFSPGHYYSPIVNPNELASSGFSDRQSRDKMEEVGVDYHSMESFFRNIMSNWTGEFAYQKNPGQRYFVDNDMYGVGDAIILSAFLKHFQPRNWIEVGSGFSSAVLLDTLEKNPDIATRLTFIEPNTDRLESLLRETDRVNVRIIEDFIQNVDLNVFNVLRESDVLFLDTTHVVKTGSDVCHEIFHVLPKLASGVIVHFHDCFDRLEYPDPWIYDENRSWNEQYIIRAFLMYNVGFEVIYMNDSFARRKRDVVASICPQILENPGGGLWLRKR